MTGWLHPEQCDWCFQVLYKTYIWQHNPDIGYNFKDHTKEAQRETGVSQFEMFSNGPVQCVLLLPSHLYTGCNMMDDHNKPKQL